MSTFSRASSTFSSGIPTANSRLQRLDLLLQLPNDLRRRAFVLDSSVDNVLGVVSVPTKVLTLVSRTQGTKTVAASLVSLPLKKWMSAGGTASNEAGSVATKPPQSVGLENTRRRRRYRRVESVSS